MCSYANGRWGFFSLLVTPDLVTPAFSLLVTPDFTLVTLVTLVTGDFPLMDPRLWYVGHYVGMYTTHLSLIFLKSILSGSGNFLFAFRSSIFCLFHFIVTK
jgi:hypothetical protein